MQLVGAPFPLGNVPRTRHGTEGGFVAWSIVSRCGRHWCESDLLSAVMMAFIAGRYP